MVTPEQVGTSVVTGTGAVNVTELTLPSTWGSSEYEGEAS
jgi:hypothetical protein